MRELDRGLVRCATAGARFGIDPLVAPTAWEREPPDRARCRRLGWWPVWSLGRRCVRLVGITDHPDTLARGFRHPIVFEIVVTPVRHKATRLDPETPAPIVPWLEGLVWLEWGLLDG
jgi:hypothetical protein